MCDGQFGELYTPNDPNMLARAISLIIDKGEWGVKCNRIAALAEKNFGIARVVNQILAELDTV